MANYIIVAGIRIATDFVPETFGRLTTIGPVFKIGLRRYQVCQCSCGKIQVVACNNLHTGHAQSCGCLRKENTSKAKRSHGLSGNCYYWIWVGIVGRCYDARRKEYPSYGGRGITICDRWLEPNGQGIANFTADMGPRPGPEYTVDRYPNRDGNYEPGNCRWATKKEQSRNRRNNRTATAFGQTKTIAEWCELFGLAKSTVTARLDKGIPSHLAISLCGREGRKWSK